MSKSKKKKPALPNRSREAKKAMVLNAPAGRKKHLPVVLAAIVVVAVAGVVTMLTARPGTQGTTPVADAAAVAGSGVSTTAAVTLPVAQFADGKARHYSHDLGGGAAVKYFVLKSADGVIRAAFDACDVCWPAGKGYYQDGDQMVCRNCGRRFDSVRVNDVQGGCNPAPLRRSVEGDRVVIQVRDIVEGRRFFNFDGKV